MSAGIEQLPLAPAGSEGFTRPSGDIVTLLDLTPRDYQDNVFTPLAADKTWWLPSQDRRTTPFTTCVQQFPFRGPTGFGQKFTFDLKSTSCGDLLLHTILQIDLSHWLSDTDILRMESGQYASAPPAGPGLPPPDQWFYANSLGTVILERAEFEVNDQTIEIVDGDFLNVASLLFQDLNTQFGLGTDGLGRSPLSSLLQSPMSKPFPTQGHSLFIPLPFFYSRVKLQEAFPLLACKEGSVRINIQLRPFKECVRLLSGRRTGPNACDETPLGKTLTATDTKASPPTTIQLQAAAVIPQFKNIQLITYAAHTDGQVRQKILRNPFEVLTRNVTTFHFTEPLKYVTNKSSSDTIQVILPLELNHPMEEIVWFVRRKAVQDNNEWTNYSAVMSAEYDATFNPTRPMLESASIQFNGVEVVKAEEQWFRQHIALRHKGGIAAYENFIYGYSFSNTPGEHQPSGTANASRLQNIRLTLNINPPGGKQDQAWEVKVFVVALQWLRFQDGLSNKMYTD